jgi:hypothetical protein
MVTEFTDRVEFKRLIEEQQIKSSKIKTFFKKQGIFLLNNSPSDLAIAAYPFFLGSDDLSILQQYVVDEINFQKSTMLVVEPQDSAQTQDELLDLILDEMNRHKNIGAKNFEVGNIILHDDGNVSVSFHYEKRVPGKLSLVSVIPKSVDVHIEKVSNSNKVIIDIRRSDSSDSKEIVAFMDRIRQGQQDSSTLFQIGHISIDALTQQNKVEFFDRISKNKFANWKLETITGITVRKNDSDEDDELIEEDSDIGGALAGIRSAILRGTSLRTNEFVQTCLKSGFMISSMKFKYSHRQEAISVVVDVNFKGTDIRIDCGVPRLMDSRNRSIL